MLWRVSSTACGQQIWAVCSFFFVTETELPKSMRTWDVMASMQHTHVSIVCCAGKSAALIMRHINGPCMQQARALFEAQTLNMLRAWSMKDAPVPQLVSPEQSRYAP